MSNAGNSFGLSAQVAKKLAGKRDAQKEAEILKWLGALTGEAIPAGKTFEDVLHDGTLLCKAVNKIIPDSVKKIQTSTMPFKQMENIQAFQSAIKGYGLIDEEVFQTADLFDKKNVAQVMICLMALGRKCKEKGFKGPNLEVKEDEHTKLE